MILTASDEWMNEWMRSFDIHTRQIEKLYFGFLVFDDARNACQCCELVRRDCWEKKKTEKKGQHTYCANHDNTVESMYPIRCWS
jgi:hypothetical protein